MAKDNEEIEVNVSKQIDDKRGRKYKPLV